MTSTPAYADRIRSAVKWLPIDGRLVEHHYYMRFIAPRTELWFFGVGLGDQAIFQQMGEAFLDHVDQKEDPELGRIMISHGSTATAFYPYKGDINLWYAWGDRPDWVRYYLDRVTVKPDLCLCLSKVLQQEVERHGLSVFYLPLAVGKVFKPLGLARKGLGFVGHSYKPKEQVDAIIRPIEAREDFEWHGKDSKSEWWTLKRLNEWYNQKQILFSMMNEYNMRMHLLQNRVFETLASGTPLISYRHGGFEDTLGYPYPYQSESAEETLALIDAILEDYPKHLERFQIYGEDVRKNHNYAVRIEALVEKLKEIM